MDTFSMAGNLRMLFNSFGFPEMLRDHEHYISECFEYDVRGTLLDDLGWFKESDTTEATPAPEAVPTAKGAQEQDFTPAVYDGLHRYCVSEGIKLSFALNPSGLHLRDIAHNNIRYVADKTSDDSNATDSHVPSPSPLPHGDSQVMILQPKNLPPIPAIIKDIVQVQFPGRELQTYLAVQRRLPTSSPAGWFDTYPILRASVWANRLSALEIVPASYMRGAYASCAIDSDKCIVISLDKVCGIGSPSNTVKKHH
jgi:hypothetical protein